MRDASGASLVMGEGGASELDSAGTRWWRVVGWACYLACSWTWCIGMFLPVLLMRDFGPWAFVVFAVPNVVGAGAMGWVLRRPGAAGRLREDHRGMVDLFSEVTIAFHLATIMWLCTSLEWDPAISDWIGIAFLAPLAVVLPLVISRAASVQHIVSIATWIVSALLLAGIGWSGHWRIPDEAGQLPKRDLVALFVVCVFGFALCPYLDRTFLWASHRQGAHDARRGFALGFGVFFLAMIVGTALYAGLFEVGAGLKVFAAVGTLPVALMMAHFFLQTGFTSVVHGRAWHPPKVSQGKAALRGGICGLAIVLCRVAYLNTIDFSYASLSLGEITYRGFMAFYGLVFPAYVWLCMIPNWTRGPATRRQWRVWLGACLVAAPMYWMGFIERETWWLVPGVGLVLAARVLVGRGGVERTGEAPPSQAGFEG